MTVQKVDIDSLITEIRKVAAEQPDHVYHNVDGKCVYATQDKKPSCIVGHAFIRLGIDPARLTNEHLDIFTSIEEDFVEGATDKKVHWVQRVQDNQDSLACWGMSVDLAGEL